MNAKNHVDFLRVHEVALRCTAAASVLLFGMVQAIGAETATSASVGIECLQEDGCI